MNNCNFEHTLSGILKYLVNNELFFAPVRFGKGLGSVNWVWIAWSWKCEVLLMLAMPATSKQAHMLEEVAEYHGQQKWACISYLASQLLDDLPSSDPQTDTDLSRLSSSSLSSSSSSSHSSQSSLSSDLSGSSRSTMCTHSRHSSSSSSEDSDSIEIILFEQWNTQIQSLVLYLLTAWVLNACLPVKKSGQLDLYLTDFWQDHPDRFWKKLCISPPVFDCLVELIEGHNIFHNNLNTPQHPIPI